MADHKRTQGSKSEKLPLGGSMADARRLRRSKRGTSPLPAPDLPGKGLASRVHWEYVVAVLNKSSSGEISTVLEEVGYRPPRQSQMWKELDKWLQSDEGRAKLDELKSKRLAEALVEDLDVLDLACRAEIQRRVERWLASPAGQEAVEQARHRVLRA